VFIQKRTMNDYYAQILKKIYPTSKYLQKSNCNAMMDVAKKVNF
jgi:hypothetical protein